MDSFEKSLYLLFPTIIRTSSHDTTFNGTFDLGEERGIKLVIFHVPNYPNAQNIKYETDVQLSEKDVAILKAASESNNFLDYLKLFETAINNVPVKRVLDRQSFEIFYRDIVTIKQQYKPHIGFDSDTLVLTIKNSSNVIENCLSVKINFEKKGHYSAEVVKCDLPKNKDQNLFKKSSDSIVTLYEKFLRLVEGLEVFYETMNKVDTICWVLDPIKPQPSHNYRRIVIDTNVSVELIFDPFNMSKAPKFKFFGPSRLTEPFILHLSENLEEWDPEYDTVQNILKLLDLPFFPIKSEDAAKSNENLLYDNTECCICFSYNLNDKTPDIICSNPSCNVQFHSICLYEWLSSLSSAAQIIFEQIHGNCPNCEAVISCQVPKKEI